MMAVAAVAALVVTVFLALIRAYLGPTVYDRVVAVNAIGTMTVLLIAAVGFLTGRPEFLRHRAGLRTHQLHRHHRGAPLHQAPARA